MNSLKPENGLIFRIAHIDNVPWILDHGLHCRNSRQRDPNFVEIGNLELILKRIHRSVPIPPGGLLSDYIPFYFTPHSPMLYNKRTVLHAELEKRGQTLQVAIKPNCYF